MEHIAVALMAQRSQSTEETDGNDGGMYANNICRYSANPVRYNVIIMVNIHSTKPNFERLISAHFEKFARLI